MTYSFRPHHGPGIDSTSNQKRAPVIFPGGKGGRWVGLIILPPSYAEYLEIWELHPPETLRVCTGIDEEEGGGGGGVGGEEEGVGGGGEGGGGGGGGEEEEEEEEEEQKMFFHF